MNTKWWCPSFNLQDMEETFVISRNCSPSRSPIAMKIPFHLREDPQSQWITLCAASSSLWSLVPAQEDLGYCCLHDFIELPIQAYSPALTRFPTSGTTILL